MERTISGMMGKGAINHNTRAFNAKNVDPERSIYNVQFCNTSIKKVWNVYAPCKKSKLLKIVSRFFH